MNLEFKNFIFLTNDEHQKLLNIRNDENIRKQMKNSDIIGLEAHLSWLKSLDEKNLYYAVFMDKNIIGCVDITSIDFVNKTSFWGIYFKNKTNPLVISACVYLLIEKIFNEIKIEKIYSEVKKANENAYKLNLSCGFLPIYEKDGYFFLELQSKKWQKSSIHRLKKKIENIEYNFI